MLDEPIARPLDPEQGAVASRFPGLLACAKCRAMLRSVEGEAECSGCGRRYELADGIPILLDRAEHTQHDEIEHLIEHTSGEHKRSQAAFYDEASAAEFEITRPHGAPALYQWLLARKLRRATRDIAALIPGGVVLTVCGGSGMDAEFYARMGAQVINADISLGAARRTRERAERFGLDITPVVADAEALPFADRSVDIVAVHDGLHHLEDPRRALTEMARVAGRAVSITEPADAAVTAIAIKLGLARAVEEAGNPVVRLDASSVRTLLEDEGFAIVASRRYVMYYRHVPGPVTRLLSRPLILPIIKIVTALADVLVGRLGNKLVVVAARTTRDG